MKYVDLHCDTITRLMLMEKCQQLYSNSIDIDLKRMLQFDNPLQIFAIFLNYKNIENKFELARSAIEFYYEQLSQNSEVITHINNYDGYKVNISKISSMLSIEGLDCIENDLDNIYKFYDMGVRSAMLTWNYDNQLAGSCYGGNKGLTDFGKQVVKEMNKINILVDVSHIGDKSFYDIVDINDKPIIASHSNSRYVVNNARNLTDEQLKIIAETKGIVGLNLHLPFLNGQSVDSKSEMYICNHLEKMMNILGEDGVCIGLDLDGTDMLPKDIDSIDKIPSLHNIIKNNFSKTVANKVIGDNYIKFMKNNF